MTQAVVAAERTSSDPAASQFLTFVLGDEQYGVEILQVQEIRGYSGVTPIPNTPPYIKGVMNLRGTVVPVIDLRARFSMEAGEYDKFTVIVVVTVGEKVIGLVVDAVSDVLDIPASEIRATPDLGARVDTQFISGMANIGGRLAVLLDIQRLLSEDEIAGVGRLGEEETAI
jgi:purine-binding chemotaxis protein CheW